MGSCQFIHLMPISLHTCPNIGRVSRERVKPGLKIKNKRREIIWFSYKANVQIIPCLRPIIPQFPALLVCLVPFKPSPLFSGFQKSHDRDEAREENPIIHSRNLLKAPGFGLFKSFPGPATLANRQEDRIRTAKVFQGLTVCICSSLWR